MGRIVLRPVSAGMGLTVITSLDSAPAALASWDVTVNKVCHSLFLSFNLQIQGLSFSKHFWFGGIPTPCALNDPLFFYLQSVLLVRTGMAAVRSVTVSITPPVIT